MKNIDEPINEIKYQDLILIPLSSIFLLEFKDDGYCLLKIFLIFHPYNSVSVKLKSEYLNSVLSWNIERDEDSDFIIKDFIISIHDNPIFSNLEITNIISAYIIGHIETYVWTLEKENRFESGNIPKKTMKEIIIKS